VTDLVIRPLTAGEEDLFESLPDPGLVGFAAFGDSFADMAAAGEYRPEWSWVALRDGLVVARAAWWAGPKDDKPLALDWFDFTDPDAAVQLLRTSPLYAQYSLKLPPGWRDNSAVREQAQARIDAAVAADPSPFFAKPVSSTISTPRSWPRCSITYSRRSSRISSACHRAVRSSRCIVCGPRCPAC
jgi:hypothetical protein